MALPSGYVELEYIQSSGTQRIDTGIVPDANTRVVMDFQLLTADSTTQALFGCAGYAFRWYGPSLVFRSQGSSNVDFGTGIDGTARHTVDKTATITKIDGTNSVNTTAGSVTQNLLLLAHINASKKINQYASTKLYSCQIYSGSSLVCSFVPVKQTSDWAVGLLDTVNNVFYGNAGTGTFTAGPVNDPTAPKGDHNTLIDGVSYVVTELPVLVGGVAYAVKDGRCLVNGVGYDVKFGPGVTTVILSGNFNSQSGYVTIAGTKYTAATTLEFETPPEIAIYVSTTGAPYSGYVKYNGNTVMSTQGTYTFTPSGTEVTIDLIFTSVMWAGMGYWSAEITDV